MKINLKKISSLFILTAVLSVFSCCGSFLSADFFEHLTGDTSSCIEKHCLADCVSCDISRKVLEKERAFSPKPKNEENFNTLQTEPPLPDFGLILDQKIALIQSPQKIFPTKEIAPSYVSRLVVENVVLII